MLLNYCITVLIITALPSFVSADAQQDRIIAECIKAIGRPCKDQEAEEREAQRLENERAMAEIDSLIKEIDERNKEQRLIGAIERTNSRLLDIQINQTRMLNRQR